MSNSSILILDDDERWVALHERRLRGAGLECRSTLSADEAIKIIQSDKSIEFALIDEILYVPPIPGMRISVNFSAGRAMTSERDQSLPPGRANVCCYFSAQDMEPRRS